MNSYQGAWGEDRTLKPSERLAAFEAWDTLFGSQNHLAESVIKTVSSQVCTLSSIA